MKEWWVLAKGPWLLAGLVLGLASCAPGEPGQITLSSTTSTRDSGLLDDLLPRFRAATGIEVRVVAVGTGRAIDLARRGDADVLLVHHRPSEEAFVAAGYGLERHPVMYNDFVLVGPRTDPAGIAGTTDVSAAMARLAATQSTFLSRGDDSGTHKAEQALWRAAGIEPTRGPGSWYRETGAGMGSTLNTANQMPGYTLTDRGTWVAFRNRADLMLVVENDPRLRNEYGIIAVNPARHPHVRIEAARQLIAWITSPAGRGAIAAFRVEGEQLFFPIPDSR